MRVRLWQRRLAAQQVAVLTCMDMRVDLSRVLKLHRGTSVVIRNAGGRAGDALRSLVIAHQELGLREVFVIHHTDCHLLAINEAAMWQKVRFATGVDIDFPFLAFSNLEQSIREDVELLRMSPLLLNRIMVRGFIYNERSATLAEVIVPTLPFS
jgi:carbonic anhydrase